MPAANSTGFNAENAENAEKGGNRGKATAYEKKKSRPKAWDNKAQANGLGFEEEMR